MPTTVTTTMTTNATATMTMTTRWIPPSRLLPAHVRAVHQPHVTATTIHHPPVPRTVVHAALAPHHRHRLLLKLGRRRITNLQWRTPIMDITIVAVVPVRRLVGPVADTARTIRSPCRDILTPVCIRIAVGSRRSRWSRVSVVLRLIEGRGIECWLRTGWFWFGFVWDSTVPWVVVCRMTVPFVL